MDNVKRQIQSIAAEEDAYVKHQNILDSPISIFELRVVESFPNGKAPGIDRICYEHVNFGDEILRNHLVLLYNAIITFACIPPSFKLAIKVPIPKGSNQQARTFGDHQGISLLPVLGRILQRTILNRI